MENARIHKLLLAEYEELAGEKILVESPFAETTRDGRGLGQVALGLTRTKLLVATDVFRNNELYRCLPGIDPSIETLELISVYPLEFITLSVFRRRSACLDYPQRRFCDGRAKYFELGGLANRAKYWRRWRDRVRRLLERKCLGSSLSETTVAGNSTCASTCYLVSSGCEYDSGASGRCVRKRTRLYAGGDHTCGPTWTQKDLYLGPGYQELMNGTYAPQPVRFADASLKEIKDELADCSPNTHKSCPVSNSRTRHLKSQQSGEICDVIYARKNDRRSVDRRLLAAAMKESLEDQKSDLQDMFQFKPDKNDLCRDQCPSVVLDIEEPGSDILRNTCASRKPSKIPKFNNKSKVKPKPRVEARTGKIVRKLSRFGFGVEEKCNSGLCLGPYKNDPSASPPVNFHELVETGVVVWENARKCKDESAKKHLRRYGLSTATYFLHALGPWSVQPGDRESCQSRQRSNSCVTIRRQPVDPELRLPVSRRQLAASISLTDLSGCSGLTASTRGRVVLFWTPDYWYRPRAATDAYREIRRHLGRLSKFRAEREKGKVTRRSSVFGRKIKPRSRTNVKSCNPECQSTDSTTDCIINRIFSNQNHERPQPPASGTSHLRRLLRLDFRVTLWDLDSTTLSHQLTLIDRELFLRIPWRRELAILAKQRASRDAPNLGAWIAFAHRVACLTASEILAARKVDMRARLVARLVNAAERCFLLGNFHSARSIVAGLQSPAVYRLRDTWTHLKTRHATRYETMEKLSKVFRSTRTRRYRRAWSKSEASPPAMPFVGDVLVRLLGLCGNADKPERTVTKAAVEKQRRPAIRQKGGLRKWIPRIKFRSPLREEEVSWTDHERQLAKRCCDHWRDRVKRRRPTSLVDELADWLEGCQRQTKQGYDFPGHSLAWEFLLKARYREDRDNFFASLQLEPPTVCG
ncbi:uncharacterized protein LOC100678770 isoform X1 [Nasonia vitripennis]|uniref:Ras-GEF domain-containing protein n=1 Tax=Nasonia vitripennis TaxID=7425 RepID=A0A7M7J2W6_NASVI|nr:uncharacterized protein LOC100678770 isoform X1 [Nasonia vitripennis]